MTRTVSKNNVKSWKINLRSQLLLPLSVSPSLSTSWWTHRITENLLSMCRQYYIMLSQSILRMLKISWPLSIRTLSLIFKLLLTSLLVLSQSVSASQLLNSKKTLDETCTDMTEVTINTWVISVTVTETARIKVLNLKKTETVSTAVFILTFLVKVNIRLCFSLSISLLTLLTVKPPFLLQTASFKALFLSVLWIRTFHLIAISSDLLIQSWYHCRFLLTTHISCCNLHQKTQICIVSLIRIELNSHTISETKVNTDLITLSSLRYTMTRLQISTISLRTTKMTTITMTNLNKKMVEQITSLMRIMPSLKLTKRFPQKSMRMLTSIML